MRAICMLLALAGCTSSNPAETCTQAVCPLGGRTYKFCSSAGATSCHYVGSDGSSFRCQSCGNCQVAATQIASWCSMGGGTTGTNGGTTGTGTGGTTGTAPLTGCNGLLMCYINCNSSNPTQACFDDCDAHATQQGLDLLNAFGTCIDSNCFQAINNDSGMPFCDPNSNDPTAAPACNDCYNRILGTNGACRSAQTACANDKP
jgi:hypothetical protein